MIQLAPFPELTAYVESYRVAPGLFAGSHPARIRFDPLIDRVIETMISHGVTTFIDLTTPGECGAYDHLLPFGINYLDIPITYSSVPDQRTVIGVLNTIDQIIGRGGSVYIHCCAGVGRTGLVAGSWLMRHRLAGLDVISSISALRGDLILSPDTREQRDFVRNWPHGL